MPFQNKKVLVTGGTKGIGFAAAQAFLNAGSEVIVTARSKPENFPHTMQFIAADFSQAKSLTEFCSHPKLKDIDILINCAGINRINSFHEIPENDFDEIMQINIKAPFLVAKALIPGMKERNFGRIVNIASIFSHISKEFRASYSTSKFGLIGMTKAIAIEYAPFNILCNAVSPGFIDTELTRSILNNEQIAELTKEVPAKRLGTAEEIAKVILFLASSENTFITGQNIIADGGFTSV